MDQLEDPTSALSRKWDEEHDQFVLQRLMATVAKDVSAATRDAFRRTALAEGPAAAVAADLKMSVNAVLTAKSRVLRRLREEAVGLID